MIPLVDVTANNAGLRRELDAAISKVVDSSAFVLGPAVDRFEKAFAKYSGVKHCVGVQSGTAAVQLALLSLGIGPGDEVLVPAMTFFATGEGVSLTGAVPVFVDVEPATLTMDPAKLEKAIGPRTKAIVPVHLYGQMADLSAICAIAASRGVTVVEDACQAHGALQGGKRAGAVGRAGCFSFYPGKNLGCFGEGGAVTTDDDALASKIRLLRDHGSPEKYKHTVVGFNYRMEGIQGAVLDVKLPHLDGWNAARRALATRYRTMLAGLPDLTLPEPRHLEGHVWHLFVARTAKRETVLRHFEAAGIARAIHYPTPLHLLDAYAGLGYRAGDFPVAEAAGRNALSLPLYPELSHAQQDQVIGALREVLG